MDQNPFEEEPHEYLHDGRCPDFGVAVDESPIKDMNMLWARLGAPTFGLCIDGGYTRHMMFGIFPMLRHKRFHGFSWPDGTVTQAQWVH